MLTVVDNLTWETYAFFPATDIVPLVELVRELVKPKGCEWFLRRTNGIFY